MKTARPETPEQAALVIREAAGSRTSIAVRGSGSWNPGEADLCLSTAGFDRISRLSPRDLTVSVGAGVSLGTLYADLAAAGVWAAWDPPGADRSIGSVVATGTDGPLSLGFGGIKDQLLGITMVTGAGRVVTVGGSVMKNVAGFDLTRLACGSFGLLGVITSVNLRLRPGPSSDVTLIRPLSAREGLAHLRAISAAGLTPAAVELSTAGEGGTGWILTVRLLGSDEAVAADTVALGAAAGSDWETTGTPAPVPAMPSGSTTVRIGCPYLLLPETLAMVESELPAGVISAFASSVRWTGPDDAAGIVALRKRAGAIGCPVTVERGPPALLRQVGIFGDLDAAVATVMRRLVDSFDPYGVFAAGDTIVFS